MQNLSPIFLESKAFIAIIVFIAIYSMEWRLKQRKILLFAFCVVFYLSFAGVNNFLTISAMTILTFASAILIERGWMFFFPISLIALLLIAAKLVVTSPVLQNENHAIASFLVPLGVSFFTFEFIHYLIEVNRGMSPEKSFVTFCTFAWFFPTIVSGPIRRYPDFAEQLKQLQRASLSNVQLGITMISIGYLYKFSADQFGSLQRWGLYYRAYESLTTGWLFLIIVSMRIFLDFAGYSYIAIGVARLAGIKIPRNFNAPYLSTSIIEFWNRWHISLSHWVRDYLYIPLGGNRKGKVKHVLNLIISMGIIGLWHGLGLQYLVWGFLQGFALSVNHLWRTIKPSKRIQLMLLFFPQKIRWFVSWFLSFAFVSSSWLFFFYEPLQAISILRSIYSNEILPCSYSGIELEICNLFHK